MGPAATAGLEWMAVGSSAVTSREVAIGRSLLCGASRRLAPHASAESYYKGMAFEWMGLGALTQMEPRGERLLCHNVWPLQGKKFLCIPDANPTFYSSSHIPLGGP
jgi:hypothetical protein